MPSDRRAEDLFAEWLARTDAADPDAFAGWAAAQEGLAPELHALHAAWHGFSPLYDELRAGGASADRRAERVLELLARRSGGARFEPRGEVGRGGMGRVLRVFDPDLARELALKVVLAEDGAATRDWRRTARFLQEARLTGRLQHPGVVAIHELGLDADGRLYYTMPLIEGEDLERVYARVAASEPGWTTTRVLALLLRVCETMAYAHARGVVHADLKPANVRIGRFGEVYVMDWGLARALATHDDGADGVDETAGTAAELLHSRVLGTPAYLAPERAADPRAPVAPAADVYALGAMLHRLLAGRVPRERELGAARDLDGLRAALARPVEPLPASVAPELRSIAERALADDPARRYASMQALADDLRAFLEGRVVRAHATGPWVELQKWIGRNRGLAAALLALVLSLAAGLCASQILFRRARANAAAASAERDRVLRLADLKRLDELAAAADALWPATPERVPAFAAWLDAARALVTRLALHRATLAELRSGARAVDGGFVLAGTEAQWEHDALAELVERLTAFAAAAGLLADVERRDAFARTVGERTLTSSAARAAWDEVARVLADPRAAPAYHGLVLAPQLGLVPLGRDPDSGLFEFAHLQSGDVPARGADGRLVVDDRSAIVLVLIPGGAFLMGAQSEDAALPNFSAEAFANEGPPHEVEIAPFFAGKYELTQGQWLRATGANPSTYAPGAAKVDVSLLHPVETIARSRAAEVLRRLGLALPTEAQWEYAARAGTTTAWWTGDDPGTLAGAANLADQAVARSGEQWPQIERALDDGFVRHAPVTTLRANAYGLHHVLGNVWEWCSDDFGGYDLPVRPGDGARLLVAPGMPVGRGGGYVNNAAFCRVSLRDSRPDAPHLLFGARAARPVEKASER